MSGQVNYKQKYQELKLQFMNAVDTAFRLGFEQGGQQAQQQAQQEQMQQQAQLQGGQPGQDPSQQDPNAQPGQEMAPEPDSDSENPAGSELDQHIEKLESMLKTEINIADLQKVINELKFSQEMKKSTQAISGISKALHKPSFKMGVQASHNLTTTGKAAVTMQHQIVNDVFKSWDQEEKKASKDIISMLDIEGLLKK
jgi:hypothetical protein